MLWWHFKVVPPGTSNFIVIVVHLFVSIWFIQYFFSVICITFALFEELRFSHLHDFGRCLSFLGLSLQSTKNEVALKLKKKKFCSGSRKSKLGCQQFWFIPGGSEKEPFF